jgi:integrase
MGGKLHVYRRENSGNWQCSTYLNGKNWRKSTEEDSLSHAKDFAEDWYLGLRGKSRAGQLKVGKTFKEAAKQFMHEIEALMTGERSPYYVPHHGYRLRAHLIPFFGDKVLTEITPGLVQEYRIHRTTSRKDPKTGEPLRPSRSTIHQEIVSLRQVLKTANRHGWLAYLPDLRAPFRASGKITHRGWFSPKEYQKLYEATRERALHPLKGRWRWACEQLHDYVLFMANTGLRPDEAARLEFRDVAVVKDAATREHILEIEVRGKRGIGYCKSMPGAVRPFERLRDRARARAAEGSIGEGRISPTDRTSKRVRPQPTDRLFPNSHTELLNTILNETGLKRDRDGQIRTAYSLRHTYICFRLMEGADIYQVAKNCRTSVEMIEKYYASHLKNTLDASAINVRKSKPTKTPPAKKGKR